MKMIKQIHKLGFFHLLGSNLLVGFLGFASQLFVAHLLIPSEMADIKLFQNYSTLLAAFASFGLNASTVKVCSEEKSEIEKEDLFNSALIVTVLASTLVMIIGMLYSRYYGDNIWEYGLYFSIVILFININYMFIAYLRAQHKIVIFAKLQGISRLIGIVLIILLTYIFHVYGYLTGYVLVYLLTMVFFYFFALKKYVNISGLSKHVLLDNLKTHWVYAKFAWGSNLFSQFTLHSGLFIMFYLVDNKNAIGQYAFVTIIMIGFQMITGTIQQISVQKFSSKSHDKKLWSAAYKKYFKTYIALTGLIMIISFLIYKPMIVFMYGDKYIESAMYFYLLLIAWGIRSLFAFKVTLLNGLGKFREVFNVTAFTSLLNIVLLFVLIKLFGVIGAPIGLIILNILLYILYERIYLQ